MMKLALTFLLSVVASGAIIQMEPRQQGTSSGSVFSGSFDSNTLPKQKAFKIEELKATNPGAKRIKIIYGPYKLKAANSNTPLGNGKSMDKGGTSYQYLVDDDFPSDITVLEASSEVQDEEFKRLGTESGVYNHHSIFVDATKRLTPAYICNSAASRSYQSPTVFMAGASELGNIVYAVSSTDIKTGYYLSKNRILINMIDVINYNNEEKDVYTSSELEYLPGKPDGYLDATQQLVDPGTCGGQAGGNIHPPKGVQRFSVNGTGIVVAQDGYMFDIKGHVHDGGVNLVLNINDKEVCNSKATYGGSGHVTTTEDGRVWETIREMSECKGPIKVSKGDRIYMQANFDLDLHPSREQGGHSSMGSMAAMSSEDAEQMALVITYFAPTGST